MFLPPERVLGSLCYDLIRLPDRRYTFETSLLSADDRRIVVAGQVTPSKPFVYRGEEVLAKDYWAVWFLFKDQPWDVGRFYRPDGSFTGYYVDVLEPVRWQGNDPATLHPLVDLFLDLWVSPDGAHEVLDEDEFEEAIGAGAVSPEQEEHARSVLQTLVRAAESGAFPPPDVREFALGRN